MKRIITVIRKRICPRRIYLYGTLGLSHSDDRSRLEKVCDWLDNRAERIDKYFAQPRYIRKHIFHSFFDKSNNVIISSARQIDDICKEKGLDYGTFREIDEAAKKRRLENAKEQDTMIRKDMVEIVKNVKHGKRSYKREIMQRIKNKEYNIGNQQTFNK